MSGRHAVLILKNVKKGARLRHEKADKEKIQFKWKMRWEEW